MKSNLILLFNYIKNYPNKILLFLGFLITCYVIWIRVIFVRVPRSVYEKSSNFRTIVLLLLCICYFSFIIYAIRQIFNIEPKPTSLIYRSIIKISANTFYKKIDKIFKIYIIDSPETFYKFMETFIYERIQLRSKISYIGIYLYNNYRHCYQFLYVVFVVIPRFIMVSIFLIDIFYFQYINYFYKSLIFMVIPLLFHIYLYICEHIFNKCKKFFHDVLIITPIENSESSFHFTFKKKEDMPSDPEDHGGFANEPTEDNLNYLIKEVLIWHNISEFIFYMKDTIKYWKYHLYITVFTAYFIGWSYYLLISFYSTKVQIIDNIYILLILLLILLITILSKVIIHNYYHTEEHDKKIYLRLYIYGIFYIIMLITYVYISSKIIILSLLFIYNGYVIILRLLKRDLLKDHIKVKIAEIYDKYIYKKILIRSYVIKQGNLLINHKSRMERLLYYVIIIPKILLVLIFMYVITYNKNMWYFYCSTLLLLIPFFIYIYIFVIEDLTLKNIRHIEIEGGLDFYYNNYTLNIKTIDLGKDLDTIEHFPIYTEVLLIYLTVKRIKDYIKDYSFYLSLITSIIYTIGWGYLLYQCT